MADKGMMTPPFVALLDEDLGRAIDRMAEAMWQAENHRCMGRSRLVPWAEAGGDTQARFCQLAVAALGALTGGSPWRSMDTAPRDGTVIWVCTFTDLPVEVAGSRYVDGWRGRWLAVRHAGKTRNGLDMGWQVAAPVGFGGMSDLWFAGWMPAAAIPETAAPRFEETT